MKVILIVWLQDLEMQISDIEKEKIDIDKKIVEVKTNIKTSKTAIDSLKEKVGVEYINLPTDNLEAELQELNILKWKMTTKEMFVTL